jgi:hypothetical protein
MYKQNLAIKNKKTGEFSKEKSYTILRAVRKIRLTVYFVYENKLIEKEALKIRKKFYIPANFFNEYIKSYRWNIIAGLLAHTMITWIKESRNNSHVLNQKLLKNYIYKNKNLDLYNPKYINDKLWFFIIWAKIFEVPSERLMECISNLLDYYFPTVNDKLQIQVYPSTTEEELKFVWDDIQKIQIKSINNLLTRRKFEYQTHDADKKVCELKKTTKFKNGKIAKEIKRLKLISRNKTFTYIEVGKASRRYKGFIENKFS